MYKYVLVYVYRPSISGGFSFGGRTTRPYTHVVNTKRSDDTNLYVKYT